MWNEMAQETREVAKETLQKLKDFGPMGKELW